MKQKLISSLLGYYKNDIIKSFEKFFYNKERLERYNNNNGNSFLAILKNPQLIQDSQKFIKLVNIMYLSDILFIILCCEQFRKEEIINEFYFKVPKRFGKLTKNRHKLLDLRNVIAHYKFKDFEQNKKEYLEVLVLFESCMERNFHGFKEFPKFDTKPSVKTILLSIIEKRQDLIDIDIHKDDEIEYFYNKHRILLDLCDDIALYNGYEPSDLPSPWTVFRQMYAIKHDIKPNESLNINDLPLFKDFNN